MFVTDGYISLLDVILIEMFVDDAHHTLNHSSEYNIYALALFAVKID